MGTASRPGIEGSRDRGIEFDELFTNFEQACAAVLGVAVAVFEVLVGADLRRIYAVILGAQLAAIRGPSIAYSNAGMDGVTAGLAQ